MELRQLRYFVAVAEQRHFGRAAEQLHIVQPAVSQQIARLERELGLVLFDRSHRQVSLTAAGQEFLPYASRVLLAADLATQAAADLAATGPRLLRVGSSQALGTRLAGILAEFRRRRPLTTVELVAADTPRKMADVAAGRLNAAFVRAATALDGVRVHHLWDEPLLVAAARRPGAPPTADLAEWAGLPLARAPRQLGPGVYDLITAACEAAGFTPLPGPPLGNVQDMLAGPVAAGQCWTLLYDQGAVPAEVALHPTTVGLAVPTGLAVPDPARQGWAAELLEVATAARDDAVG